MAAAPIVVVDGRAARRARKGNQLALSSLHIQVHDLIPYTKIRKRGRDQKPFVGSTKAQADSVPHP
uniref:Uncharacterized protein n=1 Tax=Oryza nivara TaxID=4536 RepID=A0A0E0GRA6_ORYNI